MMQKTKNEENLKENKENESNENIDEKTKNDEKEEQANKGENLEKKTKNEENIKEKLENENNENKPGDTNNTKNNNDKPNKLRNRLQARLKSLQKKNNSDEKNSHSRKSQFIIYQASLLQQKMTESQNDVSNDNSGISNVSEKSENKDKPKLAINDLINSKPVSPKKKKSKIIF